MGRGKTMINNNRLKLCDYNISIVTNKNTKGYCKAKDFTRGKNEV